LAFEFSTFACLFEFAIAPTSPIFHWAKSSATPRPDDHAERFHQSLKVECIRPKTPVSLENARRTVGPYVDHYCNERPHSAIGYIAPRDRLEGRSQAIFEQRKRKLAQARERRERRFDSQRTLEVILP
jgi:hypothetical protein